MPSGGFVVVQPNHQETSQLLESQQRAPVGCPNCGEREVVQARVLRGILLTERKAGRCVVCGHRFTVSAADFANLRKPTLGEPYESWGDVYSYMGRFPMQGLQVVTCVAGLMVGLIFGGWLVARFGEPVLIVSFVPFTFLGWWLGWWLRPVHESPPGKCATCGYDLRGLTVSRCPECGASFAHLGNSGQPRKGA